MTPIIMVQGCLTSNANPQPGQVGPEGSRHPADGGSAWSSPALLVAVAVVAIAGAAGGYIGIRRWRGGAGGGSGPMPPSQPNR